MPCDRKQIAIRRMNMFSLFSHYESLGRTWYILTRDILPSKHFNVFYLEIGRKDCHKTMNMFSLFSHYESLGRTYILTRDILPCQRREKIKIKACAKGSHWKMMNFNWSLGKIISFLSKYGKKKPNTKLLQVDSC